MRRTTQQKNNLIITKEKAVVPLYNFLARFDKVEHLDIFENQAEQKIL